MIIIFAIPILIGFCLGAWEYRFLSVELEYEEAVSAFCELIQELVEDTND